MNAFSEEETRAWYEKLEKRFSSAAVAMVSPSGGVMVVKARYLKESTFPGGIIDSGETAQAAAVREVFEETGIRLQESDLQFELIMERIGHVVHSYQFIFSARVSEEQFATAKIDSHEIEAYAVVSRDDIIAYDGRYSQPVVQWAHGMKGYHSERLVISL